MPSTAISSTPLGGSFMKPEASISEGEAMLAENDTALPLELSPPTKRVTEAGR